MSTLLVFGTLEQECLHLIGDIVDKHLYILLLHLERLQLILEFAHLLLLLEYGILLLLEELIQVPHAILVGLLLSLDATQLVRELLDLHLTALFEVLDLALEPPDITVILE